MPSSKVRMPSVRLVMFVSLFGILLWGVTGKGVQAQAVKPQLVKDINTITANADPEEFTPVGNTLFFAADDGLHGRELWKTDGSSAGTVMIKDIWPGAEGSALHMFTAWQGALYFIAYTDSPSSVGLWKSDGTEAGTVLIKRLQSNGTGNGYSPTIVNNILYFDLSGTVWRSDGTTDGTKPFKETAPALESINPGIPKLVNGVLLFWTDFNSSNKNTLWKIDQAGAAQVKQISTTKSLRGEIVLNNRLLFAFEDDTRGYVLWQSDGTTDGTTILKDVSQDANAAEHPWETYQISQNTVLFFVRFRDNVTNNYSVSVWKSDGTANGTAVVKQLQPVQTTNLSINNPTLMGNKLYFSIGSSFSPADCELWQSDGTANGTALIKGICPSTEMIAVGNTLYFPADGEVDDRELWKSDGTTAGTIQVKDIQPGPIGSYPREFHRAGAIVYFLAVDSAHGVELWKSDGTALGTVLVQDIHPTAQADTWPEVDRFYLWNNAFYFNADDGQTGTELWRTPINTVGAAQLRDINLTTNSAYPFQLTTVGNQLFFLTQTPGKTIYDDRLLWKTEGSPSSTLLITKEVYLADRKRSIRTLAGADRRLYFSTQGYGLEVGLWSVDSTTNAIQRLLQLPFLDEDHPLWIDKMIANGSGLFFILEGSHPSAGLWKSDGTPGGTTLVKTFLATNPLPFILVHNGILYFDVTNENFQHELWRSDGTPAGTKLLKPIWANWGMAINNKVYFFGSDNTQRGLWQSDGSEIGTIFVTEMGAPSAYLNDTFYFFDYTDTYGLELWKNPGTLGAKSELVKDINPGPNGSGDFSLPFAIVNQTFYFVADDGVHGEQLWKSDGTTAGTMLVKAIENTAADSFAPILAINERVYFLRQNQQFDRELWESDGTEAGTQPIMNLNSDFVGGRVDYRVQMSVVDNRLFFTGSDGQTGIELWTIGSTIATTATNDNYTTPEDTPLQISAPGVLTNDSGTGTLRAALSSGPTHGLVELRSDGSFIYTPTLNFTGSDAFTYTVSDGQSGTSQGMVTVLVTGTDADRDGLADAVECPATPCADPDGDSHSNAQDIDSDGDGIPDLIENQPAGQVEAAASQAAPIDSDGDQIPDYLDTDSDNDTIPDAIEGHDANGDGKADLTPLNRDSDNDGLDDAYDTVSAPAANNASGANVALNDLDKDQKRNWQDADDDGDNLNTSQEGVGDADKDGIPDYLDSVVGTPSRGIYMPVIRK